MPVAREKLEVLETQEIDLAPGTHKASVLALLARDPDEGYEPKEIAAETPVPKTSVYKVLQRLREAKLVEKMSDHYLVNPDRVDEINDILLTTQQFAVAEDISDANTAPDEVNVSSPEDNLVPEEDLLFD